MMTWKRKAGIGCGALLLLLALAFGGALYFGLFIPAVQVVEPGETGRRVSENGLLANHYPGRGEGRRPAVLMLGGSEGGLTAGARRNALALQAAGFSVLHLSYYRAPGQPPHLELIPLEHFGNAVTWLQRQPEVDPARIAILGTSKGAEAALLVASRDPRIRAVVAGAPSSVAWQGSSFDSSAAMDSSWSERGRPLPHLSFGRWRWWRDMYPVLTEALADLPRHPEAEIPVERTDARILLVCGEQDSLWPSCSMARQMAARAGSRGRRNVALLAYPDAGHAVFGQPLSESESGYDRLDNLGGTDAGNNRARAHGWPRVLAFLRGALG